jgi:hypothetical protein
MKPITIKGLLDWQAAACGKWSGMAHLAASCGVACAAAAEAGDGSSARVVAGLSTANAAIDEERCRPGKESVAK